VKQGPLGKLRGAWQAYWSAPDPLLLRFALFLLLLGLAVAAASFGGLKAYREIRTWLFNNRAEAAIEGHDWQQAQFQLQLVLRTAPKNERALRLMVRMGEELRAPWLTAWRVRLSEAAPKDGENLLRLSELALKSGDPARARGYAEQVLRLGRKQAAAENVLALAAAKEGDNAGAREHWEKARKHDPRHVPALANEAAFLIALDPAANGAELDRLLAALAGLPEGEKTAKRLGLARDLKLGRKEEAWTLASELGSGPSPAFSDRLQQLALASSLRRPELPRLLEDAMAAAGGQPRDASQLLELFAANGQRALVRQFLDRLPPETRGKPVFKKTEAAVLRAGGDWKELAALTEAAGWGIDESLRLAYRAEALEHQGQKQEAEAARGAAIRQASVSPVAVFLLLDTIAFWPSWGRETEELLWTLSKSPVFADDALTALFALYHHRGNARDLERAAERLEKLHPGQPVHAHNHVGLMLLNGSQPDLAWRRSRELLKEHPNDILALSNAALALSQQGKAEEALATFERIPEKVRAQRPFSFYEGVFLAGAGKKEGALRVWSSVDPATLLDAERDLWERSRRQLEKAQEQAILK
jgi:tetratricopeptide (TPR) repeat protein